MNVSVLAMSFGDRASTAGIVALQGMLTIFLVLALLWAAIEIMHHIIHKGDKAEKKSVQNAPAPNADDAALAAAIAAAIAASEDEGAIVAAITAAITAARAEEGNTSNFRVVSFKRATPANARRRF
ncbi:MAG: OadG family protein [Clostridia bacterium]|nr:OadG family protein [Clostridia bacterium]